MVVEGSIWCALGSAGEVSNGLHLPHLLKTLTGQVKKGLTLVCSLSLFLG